MNSDTYELNIRTNDVTKHILLPRYFNNDIILNEVFKVTPALEEIVKLAINGHRYKVNEAFLSGSITVLFNSIFNLERSYPIEKSSTITIETDDDYIVLTFSAYTSCPNTLFIETNIGDGTIHKLTMSAIL